MQKNKGGKYMHYGKLTAGILKLGDTVTAAIDVDRRQAVMRAHSATHLLDAALRQVLGDHVHQAGSLVEPDRLRFDFTHFAALTGEELLRVADIVNRQILAGLPIVTEELPIEEAKTRGAIALFGEKYGDVVRVVEMGDFSVEFCGGTHQDNTAKIGPFRITSEFSVASGVRRVEAITGLAYFKENERMNRTLLEAANVLKSSPFELVDKLKANQEEMRKLHHDLDALQDKLRSGEIGQFLASAKRVGDLHVVTASRPGASPDELRRLGDMLRDRDSAVVAVIASVDGEKLTFQAVCGKDAVAKGVKAGDIIRAVCAVCGGKGGGRPDSAMGGGRDVLMLDDALASVDNFVADKIGG